MRGWIPADHRDGAEHAPAFGDGNRRLRTRDCRSSIASLSRNILYFSQPLVNHGQTVLERDVALLDCFGSIKSSAEYAYQRLEQMVVTLELEPGSRTTEADLQKLVGVGRTPVREAIQRLAWEGLLEIRPRAGVKVAPLNGRDWMGIMEVRRRVELVLARTAARNCTPEARRMLENATEQMSLAASTGDMAAFFAADKLFDVAVAEASGNCHLVRVVLPLQTHTRRFWMHYYGFQGVESTLKRHIQLADAIMLQDVGRAVREARMLMSHVQAEASSVLERVGV